MRRGVKMEHDRCNPARKLEKYFESNVGKNQIPKNLLSEMERDHKARILHEMQEKGSLCTEEELNREASRQVRLDVMLIQTLRPRQPRFRW